MGNNNSQEKLLNYYQKVQNFLIKKIHLVVTQDLPLNFLHLKKNNKKTSLNKKILELTKSKYSVIYNKLNGNGNCNDNGNDKAIVSYHGGVLPSTGVTDFKSQRQRYDFEMEIIQMLFKEIKPSSDSIPLQKENQT